MSRLNTGWIARRRARAVALSWPTESPAASASTGRYNGHMTLQPDLDDVRHIEAGAAPTRFARGWHCLGFDRHTRWVKPIRYESVNSPVTPRSRISPSIHRAPATLDEPRSKTLDAGVWSAHTRMPQLSAECFPSSRLRDCVDELNSPDFLNEGNAFRDETHDHCLRRVSSPAV